VLVQLRVCGKKDSQICLDDCAFALVTARLEGGVPRASRLVSTPRRVSRWSSCAPVADHGLHG